MIRQRSKQLKRKSAPSSFKHFPTIIYYRVQSRNHRRPQNWDQKNLHEKFSACKRRNLNNKLSIVRYGFLYKCIFIYADHIMNSSGNPDYADFFSLYPLERAYYELLKIIVGLCCYEMYDYELNSCVFECVLTEFCSRLYIHY